jgi:hypothetical protein
LVCAVDLIDAVCLGLIKVKKRDLVRVRILRHSCMQWATVQTLISGGATAKWPGDFIFAFFFTHFRHPFVQITQLTDRYGSGFTFS